MVPGDVLTLDPDRLSAVIDQLRETVDQLREDRLSADLHGPRGRSDVDTNPGFSTQTGVWAVLTGWAEELTSRAGRLDELADQLGSAGTGYLSADRRARDRAATW